MWPTGRRRTRALRTLAKGQIATNVAFEAFITRGLWGRFYWLFFGR